jgi:hypothetical protein
MVILNQNLAQNNLRNLIKMALDGDQNSYQKFLLQISKIVRAVIAKKIIPADVEDVCKKF